MSSDSNDKELELTSLRNKLSKLGLDLSFSSIITNKKYTFYLRHANMYLEYCSIKINLNFKPMHLSDNLEVL